MKYIFLFFLFLSFLPRIFAQEAPVLLPSGEASSETYFIVTAYYSPLPNQKSYLRGTYEADIRLNGNGTHGASGLPVFPGMIAAPKSYPFGTKIFIQGLGVGTVSDRGGAIVATGVRNNSHDRLDIWMGYGDEGLRKALLWGKRTVRGSIVAQSTPDTIADSDFLQGIKFPLQSPNILSSEEDILIRALEERKILEGYQNEFLSWQSVRPGSSHKTVRRIQQVLSELGYFWQKDTSIYGQYTQEVIALIQLQIGVQQTGKIDQDTALYLAQKYYELQVSQRN